ncbi:MAG: AraC family transcriptional regulator [Chryseobacterium sp.]|nr:MAG: AraC family transcriptional regulator [Chryseobacterium sp.]
MCRSFVVFAVVLLCLLPGAVTAQNSADLPLLIAKTAETVASNPDDAITGAQNLLLQKLTDDQRLTLQGVVAEAYFHKGDYLQSVKSIENAAANTGAIKPLAAYNLVRQYSYLGLYQLSDAGAHRLLQSDNKGSSASLQAKLYRLLAENALHRKMPGKALEYIDKANAADTERKLSPENLLLEAACLADDNRITEAKSLLNSIRTKSPLHRARLLLLHAEILKRQHDYRRANDSLSKAMATISPLSYEPLKLDLIKETADNYRQLGDYSGFRAQQTLYLKKAVELEEHRKDGIRYLVNMEAEQYKNTANLIQQKNDRRLTYYTIAILAVLITAVVLLLILRSNKKSLQKQLLFFDKISQPQASVAIAEKHPAPQTTKKKKESAALPKETETLILQKLNDFESSEQFMQKNMSLSTLATYLDVNPKYLSETINRTKGKNFNAYINELRINRIAFLLKNSPEYRNYKISYLAEHSGFSSHSAFATVFKSVTGMTPNAFINLL